MNTTTDTITAQQRICALLVAMAETLKEAKEMPAGIAYAALQGRCNLDLFQGCVAMMVKMGICIQRRNNMLEWQNPIPGSPADKFMQAIQKAKV